ncbi:MAG: hypothetical protein H0V33_09640 [Acidimicrobiia bacterium]|nr:hypothetical protein [Acidimicrobiia bacterium]
MAAHGYGKFGTGGRIPGTARGFAALGMTPGRFHAVLAATTEALASSSPSVCSPPWPAPPSSP